MDHATSCSFTKPKFAKTGLISIKWKQTIQLSSSLTMFSPLPLILVEEILPSQLLLHFPYCCSYKIPVIPWIKCPSLQMTKKLFLLTSVQNIFIFQQGRFLKQGHPCYVLFISPSVCSKLLGNGLWIKEENE